MARRGRSGRYSYDDESYYPAYVPVAERARRAHEEATKLEKKGQRLSPVRVEGRKIAQSFWGKAWCDNLSSYSDYANRLPRGSSYVRNGLVIDLQISEGSVKAQVRGTRLYKVEIKILPLEKTRFSTLVKECAGQVDSMIELLQGKLSKGVMEILCDKQRGLFPAPREMTLRCSCPDWADMCKHVAAALYGVGNRLDHSPELLFVLRGVDHRELIVEASQRSTLGAPHEGKAGEQRLQDQDLSALFGIELAEIEPPSPEKKSPEAQGKALKPKASSTGRKAATKAPKPAPRTPAPAPMPKKQGKASASGRTKARTAERKETVTAKELLAEGVSRSAIQGWLQAGFLQKTSTRGEYRTTASTAVVLAAYLKRRQQ